MNSKKFKYVIAPEGCCVYLTPGRKYPVVGTYSDEPYIFIIIDDEGDKIYAVTNNCEHLSGKDWIIPPAHKYTLTINGTETFESDSFDDIINKVDTYNAKDINVIIES